MVTFGSHVLSVKALKMPFRLVLFYVICISFFQFYILTSEAQNISSHDTSVVNMMLREGNNLYHTNPDSAVYFYQTIYNHYTKIEKKLDLENIDNIDKEYLETLIMSINKTGDIYYYKDEYKRSEMYYQRSLELSKEAGFNEFWGRALLDIGFIRYSNNEFTEAKELFEESLQAYKSTTDTIGLFNAFTSLGLVNKRLGEFIKADSCYSKALKIVEDGNDLQLISDVKINRGILLCEQGKLEEGIALFEEALDNYEKNGNMGAISDALMNIGVVMKMVKEYDKALEYISRSTEIAEVRQQKSQLVSRYYQLADLYLEMHENEKAYEYCTKIQIVAEEIASKPFISDCHFLLGKYYFIKNDNDRAIEYFQSALNEASNNNDKPVIANIYLWYAKALFKGQKNNEAMRIANLAYNYASEMKLLPIQKEISYLFSNAFEKTGNFREAFVWFRRYYSFSDSIRYFEQQNEIRRIEARYNFEKKEKENELLRNQTIIQEQKLKSRNNTAIALIVGIALSLAIIFLLYKRNKDAKMLYQQQQMLSLQRLDETSKELEGKKRELASKMMFLNQKNEMINKIISQLQEIQNSSDISFDELNSIVSELRIDAPQSNWKEFETQFVQVHPDFYKRLYEKHPALSSYEQRICAFLRMNLNTKEIVAITGRSLKSIEVTRSRIRKKLNLSRKDNLSNFLASF